MKKIATHNSCTGEEGYGWTRLFTLFSKCQNKTLIEQYRAGVRYFDIRIRHTKRGLIAACGLWQSDKTVYTLLKELYVEANEPCYISITYEGKKPYWDCSALINNWKNLFPIFIFTYFAVKKPKWEILKSYKNIPVLPYYKILDFRSWHTLIPIPIFWKKIYYNKVKFNNKVFKMVDFI